MDNTMEQSRGLYEPTPCPTRGMVSGPPAGGYQKVHIDKVENGFIIEVGCKTFVAEDWKTVASGLELYYKDPEAARKKFVKA